LRRSAQGVVKILFQARLNIPLIPLIEDVPLLVPFMRERIAFYLRDVLRFFYDEVAAVMVPPITTLADLEDRAEAIQHIRPTEDFEPLAASFKRIRNILSQANFDSTVALKPDLLAPGPEKDLYDVWLRLGSEARKRGSYEHRLSVIAGLRPHVDLFFDKILVNDPNPAIRENRLALLSSLLTESSTIADFSEIVTKG
jgi:glycyl-tRNA synthetase beta chain